MLTEVLLTIGITVVIILAALSAKKYRRWEDRMYKNRREESVRRKILITIKLGEIRGHKAIGPYVLWSGSQLQEECRGFIFFSCNNTPY